MDRIYPINENKRLTERRSGFMARKNKVANISTSCFICNNPINLVTCSQCLKLSCNNCQTNNLCIICDRSEVPTLGQFCFYKCFKFR